MLRSVPRALSALAVLACLLAGAVLVLGGSLPARAATGASPYAPLDRKGPPLDVPARLLRASLHCSGHLAASADEPVLLVPGTLLNPTTDYSWNYERAFTAQHRPWCAVTLPDDGLGPIPTAGEYVVHAIRTMYARSGRRVEILGHSQGGMVPRWALRFWPDTRHMVDDVIGMSPSNHGTLVAYGVCPPAIGCQPAIWQQESGSPFIAALNSGAETFKGISYTDIYTSTDEVVFPNLTDEGSSSLHTGQGRITNVSVQRICPVHVADHILVGTSDPVSYALVMDALEHRGPARPSRISPSVCTQLLQPGVDPATYPTDLAETLASVATLLATQPRVPAQPALPAYVMR